MKELVNGRETVTLLVKSADVHSNLELWTQGGARLVIRVGVTSDTVGNCSPAAIVQRSRVSQVRDRPRTRTIIAGW